MMSTRIGALVLFAISAAIFLAIDLGSKSAVFAWLGVPSYEPFVLIPGWLRFNTAYNEGGIWSIGAGLGLTMNFYLACFGAVAVAGIIAWACFTFQSGQRVFPVVLGAILAGALGNFHDRVVHGGVRDFIQFHYKEYWYFPTFNVADSCLVCGAIFLVLSSFFLKSEPATPSVPVRSAA